jgi:hypothetical protein
MLRRGVLILALIALVIAGHAYLRSRPPGPRERLETLRAELQVLRLSVDSCQASVAAQDERFRTYDTRLDSLFERIEAYESLDPEGVPADSYALYLETFDQYNESVPGWSGRADSLRARWGACRTLTQSHNLLADSVRRILLELGG